MRKIRNIAIWSAAIIILLTFAAYAQLGGGNPAGSGRAISGIGANALGTITTAGTCNWSLSSFCSATGTASNNATITMTNPANGGIYVVEWTNPSATPGTVTFSPVPVAPNGVAVGTNLFNATASTVSSVTLAWDGTSYIILSGSGQAIGGGPYTAASNGTAVTGGTMQAQPTVTITGMSSTGTCYCQAQTLPATWQTGIALACLPAANAAICEEINPTASTITPATVTLNVKGFY